MTEAEASAEAMAAAIRDLRKQLGLTQVQFAHELSITPTSVYRYESGASMPNGDVLTKLLQTAVNQQLFEVAENFASAWSMKTGLSFSFEGTKRSEENPLFQAILDLRPDQQLAVMSFVKMLESNTDDTTAKMIRLILEPWTERAKEEFGRVDFKMKAGEDVMILESKNTTPPHPKGLKAKADVVSSRKPLPGRIKPR